MIFRKKKRYFRKLIIFRKKKLICFDLVSRGRFKFATFSDFEFFAIRPIAFFFGVRSLSLALICFDLFSRGRFKFATFSDFEFFAIRPIAFFFWSKIFILGVNML